MTKEKVTELQSEMYSKEEDSLLHSAELESQLSAAQSSVSTLQEQLLTAQHNEVCYIPQLLL